MDQEFMVTWGRYTCPDCKYYDHLLIRVCELDSFLDRSFELRLELLQTFFLEV